MSDIAELAYDGNFFDDVLELVPDGKRKDNVVDELTAMSDSEAKRLASIVA